MFFYMFVAFFYQILQNTQKYGSIRARSQHLKNISK